MPSPREFYDGFDVRLLGDFLGGNQRTEAALMFACEHLSLRERKSVLDLGCGIGWSTCEISRALPDASVVGLDLSPRLIQLSQQMFSTCGRVRFTCDDLTRQDWRESHSREFDACVMLDVYEHIPTAARFDFHRALSSVLTDDAILVLTCPTPLHQRFLHDTMPEGLQPVDEKVNIQDLVSLAAELSAELSYFEPKAIWATNDYFHAAIERRLARRVETHRVATCHKLLTRRQRLDLLASLSGLLDHDTIVSLEAIGASRLERAIRRLRPPYGRTGKPLSGAGK